MSSTESLSHTCEQKPPATCFMGHFLLSGWVRLPFLVRKAQFLEHKQKAAMPQCPLGTLGQPSHSTSRRSTKGASSRSLDLFGEDATTVGPSAARRPRKGAPV